MGLSSPGDAYVNFGVWGGCIFMFCLGLLFSEVLNGFYKYSKYYPFLLLFTPLIFYYPIRPDCELQTSLGHLVKGCMLVFAMMVFWKKDLTRKYVRNQLISLILRVPDFDLHQFILFAFYQEELVLKGDERKALINFL